MSSSPPSVNHSRKLYDLAALLQVPSEIPSGLPENHDTAARHVLTAVIADPFDHGGRAAVADGEPLAGQPTEVRLAAIDHAGLTTADIDGLSTYPGPVGGLPNGFSGAGAYEMIDALRLAP